METPALPVEVWNRIFLYLPMESLGEVDRVCVAFRCIVDHYFGTVNQKWLVTTPKLRQWDPDIQLICDVRKSQHDFSNGLLRICDRGTLLRKAVETKKPDVVRRLLACGFAAQPVLKQAVSVGVAETVQALLAAYAYPTDDILKVACDAFRLDVVDQLLLSGANPGRIELHSGMYAAVNTLPTAMRCWENSRRHELADALAQLQWIGRDTDGRNGLLHMAAEFACDTGLIALFVQHGCNLNGKNGYGATPLIVALANGHSLFAKALEDAGANPNLPSDAGITPQMIRARTVI